MRFHRIHKVFICLTVLVWLSAPVFAGLQESRALEIKAAFLIQFSKYLTWPESSFDGLETPVIIGILGRDPFGSVLDKIARSSMINGRNVKVMRFDNITSVKKIHILFVSSPQVDHMVDVIASIADRPVLLVGENEHFLEFGIINFVIVENKVRFNISKTNADRYRLKISSKLLRVANEVK
ncbi:MAG: YfiR family protein [Desulfobulbaceae bacterium]|nr:YfiR family protein [Desulfobulbaceae bacterium]